MAQQEKVSPLSSLISTKQEELVKIFYNSIC